jgi:hypothetical protein
MKLSASWHTLGRLVRQPTEERVLRDTPEVLQPLAADTELALPRFDACAFAATVSGLASLHVRGWRASDALWAGLATHCTRSVATMNAHDISSTVLGFAKVGRGTWLCDPALLDAIAEEVAQRGLRDFKPRNLANTAWAYATAGHAAPTVFDAIAREAVNRLHEFTPQNLSNTAWAYATAGHAAPALLDAIAEEAAQRGLRDFKPQDLASTAWAFAVADHPAPALFGTDAFVQRCAAERGFGLGTLRQLHQWQLWQEERGAAWPPLPPELAQRCRAAFCQEEGAPSRLQRDVAASLRTLGLAPREEVRTPQGYSLDAVVSHGGREVVVEVDGPSHFLGCTPTGATALKRRQLRAAGWALLPVPYWEWGALGSKAAKQEYLRVALEGLGQEAAAVVEPGAVGAPLPSEAELVAMKMPALRAFAKEHCGDGVVSLALGGEQRRTKVDVARELRAALASRRDTA